MQKSQQIADEILVHGCVIPRLSFIPSPLHAMQWAMGLSEEKKQDEEGRVVKNEYKNSIIE